MLGHYLIQDGIVLDPPLRNKWHVLEFLTRYYCRNLDPEVSDRIFETVLSREMKVSTGLGGGVAIPHARTELASETGILFVRFRDGVDWDSMDSSPVHFLFLVIGPRASAEEYLWILSKISKMLSRKPNRSKLLAAEGKEDVEKIMCDVKTRKHPRVTS